MTVSVVWIGLHRPLVLRCCDTHCVLFFPICVSSPQSKHEVILHGNVNKICSDVCFARFRSLNNLSMAGCANCGTYCHMKPLVLKIDDKTKTLCNVQCLEKYKLVGKLLPF